MLKDISVTREDYDKLNGIALITYSSPQEVLAKALELYEQQLKVEPPPMELVELAQRVDDFEDTIRFDSIETLWQWYCLTEIKRLTGAQKGQGLIGPNRPCCPADIALVIKRLKLPPKVQQILNYPMEYQTLDIKMSNQEVYMFDLAMVLLGKEFSKLGYIELQPEAVE